MGAADPYILLAYQGLLEDVFIRDMALRGVIVSRNSRDSDAVEAVNHVARQNEKPEPLTIEMLEAIDRHFGTTESSPGGAGLSSREIIRETMQDFKGAYYKALFATKRLSLHKTLIWLIWLTIGKFGDGHQGRLC